MKIRCPKCRYLMDVITFKHSHNGVKMVRACDQCGAPLRVATKKVTEMRVKRALIQGIDPFETGH